MFADDVIWSWAKNNNNKKNCGENYDSLPRGT